MVAWREGGDLTVKRAHEVCRGELGGRIGVGAERETARGGAGRSVLATTAGVGEVRPVIAAAEELVDGLQQSGRRRIEDVHEHVSAPSLIGLRPARAD